MADVMPKGAPAVDKDGRLTRPMHNYLGALERMSSAATALEALDGATLEEVEARVNELLSILKGES